METAPKDGQWIIVRRDDQDQGLIVTWSDELNAWCVDEGIAIFFEPTEWTPFTIPEW
jgi:hypothetical protein